MLELTVFIIVKMESLNEFSNWISESVKKRVNMDREIIKIIIEKKYLLISDFSVLSFINVTLFEYIWFGFVWDNRLFKENFNKLKIFITLIPELVEKKEPPITTMIKKINIKLFGVSLNEIPIFEILLDIATKIVGKLLFEFKKTNEKEIMANK